MKRHAAQTLQSLGEDRLIAELTHNLRQAGNVRVGVGDDCAVIGKPRDARWTLLKTDAIVEGIHFTSGEDMRRAGWKALCRTISDVAAMGGVPEHALVTLALPVETEVRRVKDFYEGLRKAARRFEVSIVGGETSRSPGPFFCSIALTGWVERQHCLLRSGGKPGDAIYVTGRLGGSFDSGRHLDFIPRLVEARWLAAGFKIRSMMDLSDGVASDLPRLARTSGCGFELWEDQLPKHRGCTTAQALQDGEDFELLFTLAPREGERLEPAWRKQFPKTPLTRIGTLLAPSRSRAAQSTGRGFDHFA